MIKKHNDQNIKDVIKDMISGNKRIENGYRRTLVKEAWNTKMGPAIQKYTQELTYSNGVLTVTLTSAPLRKELSMSVQKLIKILNEHCGESLIKEVKFR